MNDAYREHGRKMGSLPRLVPADIEKLAKARRQLAAAVQALVAQKSPTGTAVMALIDSADDVLLELLQRMEPWARKWLSNGQEPPAGQS